MWPGQCFRKTLASIVNNFKMNEKVLLKKARILEKSSVRPVERIMEKIHGKAATKKKGKNRIKYNKNKTVLIELQEKIKNYLDKVGKKNKSDIDSEELANMKLNNLTRSSENMLHNEEIVIRSFENKSNQTNVRKIHENDIEVLKDTIKKLTKLLMDHRKSEYIVTQEITKKLQQLKNLNRDSEEKKNVDADENTDFLMSDHTRIIPRIELFTIPSSLPKMEGVTEKYGSLEDDYYTTTFADYKLDNNEGTVAEIELNEDTFEDQIKRFKSTNWEETNQENNFDN